MTFRTSRLLFLLALLCACAGSPRGASGPPAGGPPRSRVARFQALPALDGRNLRTTVLELTYGPGGVSPPHSHPCPAIVYVIEGAIRARIQGQPEAIYRAGETFYEDAHGIHELSANASQQAPARFLAFFICDRDTPVTVPPPAVTGGES